MLYVLVIGVASDRQYHRSNVVWHEALQMRQADFRGRKKRQPSRGNGESGRLHD